MIYIAFMIFTLLVLIFVFYQWQYFMIFSPLYYREEPLCEFCTPLSIVTDDGIELEGVIYEPTEYKNRLLVFVGRSHDAVALINRFAKLYPNTQIITFNYRSYGKSDGVASEKNFLSDGVKIAELVQKNYGDFYLLGFSIGSSVAAYVATKVKVKGLFLIGAFDSIASLTKSKFGINLKPVLRYCFNTKKFIQQVDVPTYLFVSRDDEIIYIENARALKKAVLNLAYYVEFDNLHHKELLWDERVVKKIKEVIA
ncbi:alpha/beta hydrolase [Sulfurimonas paralvinellae]|uniref:Alpha/beta hydrolase n=1 Tax=Sulfurimonas paralvinellae TaxID=317658 RepID=A0A7M1B7Z4_9BACT|nr:alpha/beta hydrolase [Sulfurimonas paralvinellae]QOP45566.1 alpha/beta hydrolase [Sulfurimonas paralvinellae]